MRNRSLLSHSLAAKLRLGAGVALWLCSAEVAWAQAGAGDTFAREGRHREAAEAYQRAFEETRDPLFCRQAGLQYLELGPPGREDAIRAFRLYVQNADDAAQAQEGRALLARAKSMATEAPVAVGEDADPVVPVVAAAPSERPAPTATSAPPVTETEPSDGERAGRIDEIAGARWSPGVGFVQPAAGGDEVAGAPTAGGDEVAGAPVVEAAVVPPLPPLRLDQTSVTLGVGSLRLNPVNDDRTDDETRLNLADFELEIEGRGRPLGALLGTWIEVEFRLGVGKRKEYLAALERRSGRELRAAVPGLAARVGVDAHPVDWLGLGPLVGYRADLYAATIREDDAGEGSGDPVRVDHGPELGLHARLGLPSRPTRPSPFFFDTKLIQRFGKTRFLTGGCDVHLWLAGVYLVGWAEARVSSQTEFTFAPGFPEGTEASQDAADLGEAFARSAPIERRLGLGLEFFPGGSGVVKETP